MERFTAIARIVKVRGLRGEVAADILTDFPERFADLQQVRLESSRYAGWERVESCWFHQQRVILKFQHRDDPEAARSLVGCEVQIPEPDRMELPEGVYYDSDLIGCRVIQQGEDLGEVSGIFKPRPEVTNLVVVSSAGREFMIPLVREFILQIDVEAKRIAARLPEGLET